jgi:eukaryotic-like serine/threonine-protein kinase
VLAQAEGDGSWDVPLVEPPSSQDEMEEGGEPDEEPGEEQGMAHEPAHGVGPLREPVAQELDELPRPEAEPAAPAVAVETKALQEAMAAAVQRLERHSLALVAGLAVVALAMGSVGLLSELPPAPESASTSRVEKAVLPPDASVQGEETSQAASFREVAQPGNPAHAEPNAAPGRAQPPASPPTAMLRKKESRLKPEEKPTPQQRNKTRRCIPIPERVCTAAGVCSIMLTGCTGAQVRPTLAEPVQCPAGWKQTHARFDLAMSGGDVVLQGYKGENTERATVHEGPSTVWVGRVGDLPPGSLLFGTLQLGENRFFGTFTQAQLPSGETYPVCLAISRDVQAGHRHADYYCPAGLGECPAPESRPGNVKTFTRFLVFEKGRF